MLACAPSASPLHCCRCSLHSCAVGSGCCSPPRPRCSRTSWPTALWTRCLPPSQPLPRLSGICTRPRSPAAKRRCSRWRRCCVSGSLSHACFVTSRATAASTTCKLSPSSCSPSSAPSYAAKRRSSWPSSHPSPGPRPPSPTAPRPRPLARPPRAPPFAPSRARASSTCSSRSCPPSPSARSPTLCSSTYGAALARARPPWLAQARPPPRSYATPRRAPTFAHSSRRAGAPREIRSSGCAACMASCTPLRRAASMKGRDAHLRSVRRGP